MNVVEVLPNEAADTGVLGDGLESPSWGLIMRSRSFDTCVIDEGLGDVGDFWLENEGDIAVEDGKSVGMTLG